MDKAEIVARIVSGRAAFDARVDTIPDAAFDRVPGPSGWTAKDTLAHITSWEQRMIRWLEEAARGEKPLIPEPGKTWADLDLINARALEIGRSQSSVQVRSDARHTHQRLLAAIDGLPDDASPEAWSLWRNRRPPWKLIAANTYEHYAHHLNGLPFT